MGTSERRPEEAVDGWVLLLGDAMLDVYYEGYAKDISAEAPIVRVGITDKYWAWGGAGNVQSLLVNSGVHSKAYFGRADSVGGYPLKCRVIADGKQVARFDRNDKVEPLVLPPNIDLEGCRAVVVSDYCKGSVDEKVLAFLHILPPHIPIYVDTKRDPLEYPGRSVFFPNAKEYKEFSSSYKPSIRGSIVRKLGAEGLIYGKETYTYPAAKVVSVVGAGDVVLAAFVYASLQKINGDIFWYHECADFASYAGTRKVECPRTEAPPLKEMFESWLKLKENK